VTERWLGKRGAEEEQTEARTRSVGDRASHGDEKSGAQGEWVKDAHSYTNVDVHDDRANRGRDMNQKLKPSPFTVL
jgi:hypothetical protein